MLKRQLSIWKVARIHRELSFVKRGTLKRRVTNIRRGDSGRANSMGVQSGKLHGAAVGACILGAVWEERSLAYMRDWLVSHIGVSVTRQAIRPKHHERVAQEVQMERRVAWATQVIGQFALGRART